MTITTTRTDCTRDNVAVFLPCATTLGFGKTKAKRGNWILYERDNHKFIGRVIGRVICEGVVYVEIAKASENFSHVFVGWVKPEEVKECREKPPRAVFAFFAGFEWHSADAIHAKLAYGVSDLKDQMGE